MTGHSPYHSLLASQPVYYRYYHLLPVPIFLLAVAAAALRACHERNSGARGVATVVMLCPPPSFPFAPP